MAQSQYQVAAGLSETRFAIDFRPMSLRTVSLNSTPEAVLSNRNWIMKPPL